MRGSNINNNNNNMEPSFYEDNAQFTTTTIANSLKRPLTLDLNSKPQPKKQRINQTIAAATPLLNSPDLAMIKLTTPELEKFIMANNSLQTPTPSLVFPTKHGIPTKMSTFTSSSCSEQVTLEQEDYAKGFVDALNSLRNSENSQSIPINTVITANGMSGGSITYTNLDETFPVAIKDEPQTVPNSPPLSPIDMEDQERIKLERKRQRNRVAASKCRKRKLERISKLEDKVKMLKGENTDLAALIKQLKEHVFQLKQQVIDHINAGCDVSVYNNAILQNK